jgi:hypothetical protein
MIAELFYPKELKEVIKDLREKDDLNEEALGLLNNKVNYFYFPVLLIGLSTIYYNYVSSDIRTVENLAFAAPLLLFGIWLRIRNVWRSFMASYFSGEIQKGEVIETKEIMPGVVKFSIKSHMSHAAEDVCSVRPMKFCFSELFPKKGDEILYFSSTNSNYKSVPYIKEYMKKCCLKKSMIEGEN